MTKYRLFSVRLQLLLPFQILTANLEKLFMKNLAYDELEIILCNAFANSWSNTTYY